MKIIDKDGDWFQSTCPFPLVEPVTGAVFENAIPTKVKASTWVKSQPALLPIPDPLAPEKKSKT
jgi:hypothetical protein